MGRSNACTGTGTTGAWNAASGNSAGWQEWSIDLSAYAGGSVEISIAYASDWSTQGIGAFIDDITLPDGTSTSFETGLDGWTVAGPPEGSAPNFNDFVRTDASGFPVGNAISTPRSLLLGFGLEGVSTEAERNAVMGTGARPPAGVARIEPLSAARVPLHVVTAIARLSVCWEYRRKHFWFSGTRGKQRIHKSPSTWHVAA